MKQLGTHKNVTKSHGIGHGLQVCREGSCPHVSEGWEGFLEEEGSSEQDRRQTLMAR